MIRCYIERLVIRWSCSSQGIQNAQNGLKANSLFPWAKIFLCVGSIVLAGRGAGHSNILFSGLNHFSKCLRPAISLSTLNLCRYRHRPKTRYGMRWVCAFPVELSSTSSIGASWRTDGQVFC